ncbi:hypothetical protein DL93DRAFT_1099589 [Clavulina sp. PMI_390]|nr:hypothetical protein DL93DRAFT_1099589 [Clavulina sp. PMI_390]
MAEIEPSTDLIYPLPSPPVSRTPSRNSTVSTVSDIFVPTSGAIELSLTEFCAFVNERRSLQRARIVSVEGYYEFVGIVKHRFVLLELSCNHQHNIWLRLDRRRGKGVSIWQFIAARGSTVANDLVRAGNVLTITVYELDNGLVKPRFRCQGANQGSLLKRQWRPLGR